MALAGLNSGGILHSTQQQCGGSIPFCLQQPLAVDDAGALRTCHPLRCAWPGWFPANLRDFSKG